MSNILTKLRGIKVPELTGSVNPGPAEKALEEFTASGVKFAASCPKLEKVYYKAVHDLMNCVVSAVNGTSMLLEGSVFIGLWLESTGTISTEILSRFCPVVAQNSFELFADYIREDGLIPYKVLNSGPSYRQVQMVTPLARSVWNHYVQNPDKQFLEKMYHAMCRNDQWLETFRNTRGTGCVEAFCTFDTGNDASPRFWHVIDTPYQNDPAQCDPDSPILPFLAPDMTANVYCQRKYLQKIAVELGITDSIWDKKAEQILSSLMKYCYDDEDHYFYDRDRLDRFVKIQTDNLMRVYASEVGDDAMFEDALRRYFLNTKKYFARYPLTTFAMDDPRFLQLEGFNSWSGNVSYLTEIRLPPAFEYHHRFVELSWILHPIITALARVEKFGGGVSPWVAVERAFENYSPTMLCVLDYLERYCGIYPTPQGELWFTGLIPEGVDFGEILTEETAYSRIVDGTVFELINEKGQSSIFKTGELLYTFPQSIRVVTGRDGSLKELIGMTIRNVRGEIRYQNTLFPFTILGNERLKYTGTGFVSVEAPGVVLPNYDGK
jgi:hypothetical protein